MASFDERLDEISRRMKTDIVSFSREAPGQHVSGEAMQVAL